MKNALYAGGDWLGTPDPPRGGVDLYSFCIAAFEELEALNEACRELRRTLQMPADQEFHAHGMSDEMQADVLEMGLRLKMRLGLLIINKAAVPLAGRSLLPAPPDLTTQIAFRLLERLLPQLPLRDLWCDEEIAGKRAQQDFATQARRLSYLHLSHLHLPVRMKVRFRASHTSNLVQMADVANYALRSQARGAKLESSLVNVLRKIHADPQHLILGPVPWEE